MSGSGSSEQAMIREARQELVEVVRRMVEVPDAVAVEEVRDGDAVVFELTVADEDLGKVIGRQGRTARALRTLLEVRGDRDDVPYELEIVEG